MKIKPVILSSLLCLCLIVFGTCKQGTPTTPEIPEPDPGSELSGTITLNGAAFSNVDVYLSMDSSQNTTTGADGKYSFKNLSPGNFLITPSRTGFAFDPPNYEVNLNSFHTASLKMATDYNFSAKIATTGTNVDDIATDFTARDQNGNNVSLHDYHGKVILIDFTADWCSPCREKAETAEQFYQSYKNKGLMYILIVIEGDPSVWAGTYALTFPVLNDNSRAIYNKYGRTSIPLPHVLDRNSTIRYKKEGWLKSEVEAEINKYL